MCLAGRRAVAVAVGGRAQVRAALDDEPVVLADGGARRAAGRTGAGLAGLAGAGLARAMAGGPAGFGPFPHVAGHVEQAVAVGPEPLDRGGPGEAVRGGVLMREPPVPGVGHDPAPGHELLAPGV